MKPDARLRADILEELEWQPSVNAAATADKPRSGQTATNPNWCSRTS